MSTACGITDPARATPAARHLFALAELDILLAIIDACFNAFGTVACVLDRASSDSFNLFAEVDEF